MKTSTVDLVNIGLMLGACALAFLVPFELFLFSYAVIGPLHYLTEINWLHNRQFFTTSRTDYYVMFGLGVLLLLFSFFVKGYGNAVNVLFFMSFFYGLSIVLVRKFSHKLLFLVVALLVGVAFRETPVLVFVFGLLVPTLLHVFFFTGLFILHGALRSRSLTGVLSLVVFVGCAVSFFVLHPETAYRVTPYAERALVDSTFVNLNASLFGLFGLGPANRQTVFESAVGLSIMRFIAFAYTYHYLNWFSKIQVIKWHHVPRRQLVGVFVVWAASVGLYACNYYWGLIALYLMSVMHVFMEFPLNFRSVSGIAAEVRRLGVRRAAPEGVPAGDFRKK